MDKVRFDFWWWNW